MIVLWLLGAVATAVIASTKGRTTVAWFALGLALGPFAVLFALGARRNVAALEAEAMARGDAKRCPSCAEIIKREARFCRHCGHEQPTAGEIYDATVDDAMRTAKRPRPGP